MKKIYLVFIVGLITIFLIGCSEKNPKEKHFNETGNDNSVVINGKETDRDKVIEIDKLANRNMDTKFLGNKAVSNGKNIYYLDKSNNIKVIKNDDLELIDLIDLTDFPDGVKDFVIHNDKIYYQRKKDSGTNLISVMDLEGENIEEIWWLGKQLKGDNVLSEIYFIDDEVYYVSDKSIYKTKLDGSSQTQVFSVDESKMDINIKEIIYIHNNMIYIKAESQSKNMICRISGITIEVGKDRDIKKRIITVISGNKRSGENYELDEQLEFINDSVYILKKSSVTKLYKLKENSDEKSQIFTGYNIKKFEILNDWIYILDDGNDINTLIKAKTDGTNKELVLGETESFTLIGENIYVAQNNNNIWQINRINKIGEKENIATFRASFENIAIDRNKKNIILFVKSLGIYMINIEKSDIIFLDKFSSGIRMNENWIEYNTGTNSESSGRIYVTQ